MSEERDTARNEAAKLESGGWRSIVEEAVRRYLAVVTTEVEGALRQVDARAVAALGEAVLRARRVFVTGEGRSGLVARGFAMRLVHLGREAFVAGETVAPAAGPGDLLVAISRSGHTRVAAARAEAARAHGVRLAVIVGEAGEALGPAEVTVLVPAAPSDQFGGTLFEQATLLLLDALVLSLQERLGQSKDDMAARHATLE